MLCRFAEGQDMHRQPPSGGNDIENQLPEELLPTTPAKRKSQEQTGEGQY